MKNGSEQLSSLTLSAQTVQSKDMREAHPNLAAERSIQEAKFSLYCTSIAENLCLLCARGSLGGGGGGRGQ